jgi:rRNA maturation protein Nop10
MPPSILPIAAIHSLRLTCTHCGAAAVIPLSAKHGPEKCFNCYRELPGAQLMRLVAELRWLQEITRSPQADVQVGFDAALEHEQNPPASAR